MSFLFKGGVPTDRKLKEVNVFNKTTGEVNEMLYESFTPREFKFSYVKDFIILFFGLSVIFTFISGNSENLSVKTLLSYMSNNPYFFDRFISDIAHLGTIKDEIDFLVANPINFDINNPFEAIVSGFNFLLLYFDRFFTFFDVILGFILNGIATIINLLNMFLDFVGF